MTATIIMIGIALIWLGYETKWLTIRLPYGRKILLHFGTEGLIKIATGMVFLAVGFIMFPIVAAKIRRWYFPKQNKIKEKLR